ncbi:MAG: hypothetical protein M1837_006006 [Sclerophora amabilis]|nr:MAG: hypothetical protein M1837_006006 [Sclerophora amabilis]
MSSTIPHEEYVVECPPGTSFGCLLGAGLSGFAAHLEVAIKWPGGKYDLSRERQVYERLGNRHTGILHYYGSHEKGWLILQYANNGPIRHYLQDATEPIPNSLRLRWIEQIATAIAFLHSESILHADISCNNVFLDDNLDAKIGDFAGSSIDGSDPLCWYETRSNLPGYRPISSRNEIFALGSTFFEIMTGKRPYPDLEEHVVENAYREGKFPELDSLEWGSTVIDKCWRGGYNSMDFLVEDVQAEVARHSPATESTVNRPIPRLQVSRLISMLLCSIPIVSFAVWRIRR